MVIQLGNICNTSSLGKETSDMRNLILSLILTLPVILILGSCRKKNNDNPEVIVEEPPQVVYDNYSGLKVGNYWVYERFKIDSTGATTSLNIFDSCYVEKDTTVNGEKGFIVFRPDPIFNAHRKFWKDSLHYIVCNGIQFSYQDFTTEFINRYNINPPSDTVYHLVKKMSEKDFPVTVPAGTFVTSAQNLTYTFYPPNYYYTAYKVRTVRTRFAKNIGIITENLQFYSSQIYDIERRLVRYKVN